MHRFLYSMRLVVIPPSIRYQVRARGRRGRESGSAAQRYSAQQTPSCDCHGWLVDQKAQIRLTIGGAWPLAVGLTGCGYPPLFGSSLACMLHAACSSTEPEGVLVSRCMPTLVSVGTGATELNLLALARYLAHAQSNLLGPCDSFIITHAVPTPPNPLINSNELITPAKTHMRTCAHALMKTQSS